MIQHHLIGCNIAVAEDTTPEGDPTRSLVITDPPTGEVWVLGMTVMQAIQLGRALTGQALVVPQANGMGRPVRDNPQA